MQTYRGGIQHPRAFVKRFYISGTSPRFSRLGWYANRFGRRIYGIKVVYQNPRVAYTRRTGARVGRAVSVVSKIIELPKDATNAYVTKSPPKGALMEVA